MWNTEHLCCCDILFSQLVFVLFIKVLTGKTGTAVGISCAAADGLERSITDNSLIVSLHLLQINDTLDNVML